MIGHLKEIYVHEEGHVGAGITSLLAIAATVVLAIGLTGGGDVVKVIGVVLMGLAVVVSVTAPHEWVKRLSARLDRLNPEDPDARPGTKTRVEF